MPRFAGKSVIVTGSSNGIGRTTALLFATEGAQVTITGRNAERLEETRQVILKAGVSAGNINAVAAELTDPTGQDRIIQLTLQKFGKIDILVNNAGANIMDGTTGTDQSIDLYHQIFQVNLQSVIEMTKKAKAHLIKTKGEIVNVSSTASGPQALPQTPYYSISKAAVNQYTRSTAIDLIQHGVRVNAVSPGVVETGFLSAMGMPDPVGDKLNKFLASKKECIPAGHCGKPEDIANVILFLADRNLSSYIIGQTIVADGGSTLISGMAAHDLMAIISQ